MTLPERVEKVIREHEGGAVYIYDLQEMDKQLNLLQSLPENVTTFYSMKVNPHEKVVRNSLQHPEISGIEVASLGEMQTVCRTKDKMDLSDVIYTGPSKNHDELAFAVENNIQYLNIESHLEAHRISQIAQEKGVVQPILIRFNSKFEFKEGEASKVLGSANTQFGFPQDDFEQVYEALASLDNIRIDGIHVYPATGVLDAHALLRSNEATFSFVNTTEKALKKIFPVIDFGGGFGIDYGGDRSFDIGRYSQGLQSLIDEYGMSEKSLYLEIGRYLAADMGYFAARVNDIKMLSDGMTKAVLCEAGTNALKRPQVLGKGGVPIRYNFEIVGMHRPNEFSGQEEVNPDEPFNVYGPFCTSVDYLAKSRKSADPIHVGDFIVFKQAGAYGRTMSPQEFLSHPIVPEIILN